MSTAILTVKKEPSIPALAMSETELMDVLRNSLYPGAQDQSIKMVIGYCKASGLDPMQKPCHIVPVYDAKIKAMRDVVMPGVGLYRTQAARSGQYAGVTEPEFGEEVTEELSGVKVTYPKWCKMIVKRLMPNGVIVEFSAKEFWKENYAVKGGQEKSIAPNAMWLKRPYAQLAKCSESQALRKAFPEFGSQPTAEEMEGKEFDMSQDTPYQQARKEPEDKRPECTDDKFRSMCVDTVNGETGEIEKMGWKSLVQSGSKSAEHLLKVLKTKYRFTEKQIESINSWENNDDNA